jgi:hypothetical protein
MPMIDSAHLPTTTRGKTTNCKNWYFAVRTLSSCELALRLYLRAVSSASVKKLRLLSDVLEFCCCSIAVNMAAFLSGAGIAFDDPPSGSCSDLADPDIAGIGVWSLHLPAASQDTDKAYHR